MSRFRSQFSARDWIEVRSAEEILATLDDRGELDSLPFMPEMLRLCGQRFRVGKSAHKTCDTVNKTRGRRMTSAVHLAGVNCDGSGHGGCQAACLIFWKDDWIKPADGPKPTASVSGSASLNAAMEVLVPFASRLDSDDGEPIYSCQATRLYEATSPLAAGNVMQYWDDIQSGNESVVEAVKVLFLAAIYRLRDLPVGYRLSCWLYDRLHRLIRGVPSPYIQGSIPPGSSTPKESLDLQPGEFVEVKSREEIIATMDVWNVNRGMRFDKEMTPFCGRQYRVKSRVNRIINEQNGKMIPMRTPVVILQGAYCQSRYSEGRLLCPRQIPSFWREIWLRRIDVPAETVQRD